jgi:uncharacterized protein
MRSPGIFLTAEWKNLVMLNYAVSPSLLARFVPAGIELDSFEGVTYLSLIGFEFNRTRLLGFPIPFHQAFEEVNLRFYVRRGSKRGVVFLREFVPRPAVVAIARYVFNENYTYAPMSHRIGAGTQSDTVKAEYTWGSKRSFYRMQIEAEGPGSPSPEGSLSQFITEHYWGYAAQRDGGCVEYEVQHVPWIVRSARAASFTGDLSGHFGSEMASILTRNPDSAFLAEGSPVTVFQGRRIH